MAYEPITTHIFELSGVLLNVQYSATKPDITFYSVHVMDGNYRCVGPDLMPMLHDTLVLTTPRGRPAEAMTVLSAITEDIL